MPYTEVAKEAGIDMSERTLRRLFETEGYHRRVARRKPFITGINKVKRMDWGVRFGDWQAGEWEQVIFSDESSFHCGNMPGRIFVTRRPGEEYQENCIVPKFPKQTSVMVWGAIIGTGQKSVLVFWDRSWGSVSGPSYCERVVGGAMQDFWQAESQRPGSGYIYIQQDNAPRHASAYTKNYMHQLGMKDFLLPWPASSPDMNPIEEIWRRMKMRIARRNPRPTKVVELRQAIQEEWDSITPDEVRSLVATMNARVQALLDAEGGHTKF